MKNLNNMKFLGLLFFKLYEQRINYCVLRNYKQLPESLGGSDLDILIAQSSVNKFYTLLDEILAERNGRIIVKYGKLTPRVCILVKECDGWLGIQLDVHEGILPYKTSNIFPVEFVLNRAQRYKGILVANDDDADFNAFLKEIFHNKSCKEKYFISAKDSWAKNKDVYTDELLNIYDNSFVVLLDSILSGSFDNDKISSLSKFGTAQLSKSLPAKVKNIYSQISRIYRFYKPPGFSVAVLGTDGAGKTTLIDAIRNPLNEAVHGALFYEHMRPNLIPNIAQLLGRKTKEGPVVDPHSAKPSGLPGSLFRLTYYSFDYIFGFLLKVYPVKVKKSSIWLFDRYYYDYFIDPKRARINLPIWLIKLIRLFIPEPNLILCLGADPEVINNRKPELPLSEVVSHVNKLRGFCDKEDKAFWIDTGVSLNESSNQIMEIISKHMAARYDR